MYLDTRYIGASAAYYIVLNTYSYRIILIEMYTLDPGPSMHLPMSAQVQTVLKSIFNKNSLFFQVFLNQLIIKKYFSYDF